mgnify:CR=1 FL=1
MKIPPDAIIAADKLTRYLLLLRPKSDKSRYLAQAGFTLRNPQYLEAAIRQLTQLYEAVRDSSNEYGDFYRVEGDLVGPNGVTLYVVTIWIVQPGPGQQQFRFVTLKPGKRTGDET